MQYAEVTFKVIFEHDDSVPADQAALRIATTLIYRGPVVLVTVEGDVRPLDVDGVMDALGGCGDCEDCKANREDFAVHEVMEGSALAQFMGTADAGAIAAEQAAMTRAHERTV